MVKIITNKKMNDNEYNPISNHFFMQLMNLVVNKSLPVNSYNLYLNRVLQLAFNAGQLKVFIDKNLLDDEIVSFVKKYKLLNLSTYVNSWTQNEINEALKKQSGGHKKYEYISNFIKL